MPALLCTSVLVASLLTSAAWARPAATAAPNSPVDTVQAFGRDAASSSVTLITGDQVHLRELPDGRTAADVNPAPRSTGMVPQFHVTTRDGEMHVVPNDVGGLVPDLLDPELFNVTSLAAQGFDDATSPTLPLILSFSEPAGASLNSNPIPGVQRRRDLPSVGAVAVEADKQDIADFAETISAAAGKAQRTKSGPLAGVEKIWLDRRVETQLDRSAGQISAPAAWDAGFDGSGVTVAVLDTGIDEGHPDLAGRVAATRNFTQDPDASDRSGHGTHVASTIAGSGAASDGQRRGVASGATLLNGKVLNNGGSGLSSWVISGMEWAASVAGADIVNMSLTVAVGSPDAPVVRQAVERLSAEHGTLFVVAAGNGGCDACLGTPADAPSALTVGAVDRDGELAEFSSRGPVPGTYGLKPDITAPGVGIVAARAEDASLGGQGDYLALSGTSMATPHVAGAVALLSQAFPELDAGELKGALMSTAVPAEGLGPYEQGAGRVDVGQVLDTPILATEGSLDFGYFAFPQAGLDPVSKAVMYHNVSDEPVTFQLTAEVSDAEGGPVDVVTVEPSELTVPPGQTAAADVVLDIAATAPGQFTGHLVADVPGSRLRTPVGFVAEEEQFDVTLRGVARDGRPTRPWGSPFSIVVDVETGSQMNAPCSSPPSGMDRCVRVPAGAYSVMSYIYTKPAWMAEDGNLVPTVLHTALVGDPELEVDADMTVVLDARQAVEVEVDTPSHETKANLGAAAQLTWSRTSAAGTVTSDYRLNGPGAQLEERLFIQPMDDVSIGSFAATSRWRLEAPAITLDVEEPVELNPQYYRMDYFSGNSWQFPLLDGRETLLVADAGEGRADEIAAADLVGAMALIRRADDVPVAEQSNTAAAAGARLVAVYNDQPGLNADTGPIGDQLEVPTVRLSHEEGAALLEMLEAGPVPVRAEGIVASPYVYDLVFAEQGGVPEKLHYTADTADLVSLDRQFHAQLTDDMTFTEASYSWQPWDEFSITAQHPLLGVPRERTDYHVSDPVVQWSYAVSSPERTYNHGWPQPQPRSGLGALRSPLTTYVAGERAERPWFRQPLVPGFDTNLPVTRQGDILHIPVAGVVDAVANFAETSSVENGLDAHFGVWRGEELLAETRELPTGTILLPAAEDTFRISYDIVNSSPWARLSTRTRTEWTFRSARTERAKPVPLMTLGYDLDGDLHNRMLSPSERRGPNLIDVTVGHQAGVDVPVTGLALAVSYDDGASWREMRTHRLAEGHYSVHLAGRPPRDAQFLSFRVSARDKDGNTIEQQIIRAVAVP